MWILEIDKREQRLKNISETYDNSYNDDNYNSDCKDINNILKKNKVIKFTTEFKTLQVGDICIKKNNEVILILERKTIKDLLNSLKDGRYSEQKKRLKESEAIHKGYIIEGDIYQHEIIWQIIFRLQFKDKLICLITKNENDSYKVLIKLIDKFQKCSELYTFIDSRQTLQHETKSTDSADSNSIPLDNYVHSLSISKKENLTPFRCYIMQLKQIPGISTKSSEIIARTYPNWTCFLEALKTKSTVEIRQELGCEKCLGLKKIDFIKNYCFF